MKKWPQEKRQANPSSGWGLQGWIAMIAESILHEELQFSEATWVNISLDNQATNAVEALGASLSISFLAQLSGPRPEA